MTLFEAARQAGLVESLTKAAATRVARFVAMVDGLTEHAGGSLEQLLGLAITTSGYRDHLAESGLEEDLERLANIEELLTVAREFDERHPEQGCIEKFLEETALVGDTDDWESQVDRVTLMTLHAAKGLEFPVVFLIAAEEGLLPHERSRDNADELEEERRLMFVGLTRAQEKLQISLARRRDFRGVRRLTIPSQFLIELPRNEMEIAESTHIESYDEYDHEYDHESVYEYDQTDFRVEEDRSEMSPVELAAAVAPAKTVETEPNFDPEQFRVGMPVTHPEYGLGKITALSGSRSKRTATINFVTAGQRKFRLQESPLRPAGRT